MSGASERAHGRASGPVLQSVFVAVLDHSVRYSSLHRSDPRDIFSLMPARSFLIIVVSYSSREKERLSVIWGYIISECGSGNAFRRSYHNLLLSQRHITGFNNSL